MPYLRQTSATLAPSSTSLSSEIICCSLYFDFFIVEFFWLRNSTSNWFNLTRRLQYKLCFVPLQVSHPDKGLIAHSDQGSQYLCTRLPGFIATIWHDRLHEPQGELLDNASMESFWGLLKTELVHHRRFKTRQQAMPEITEYIEIFYNRQRK